MWSFLEDRPIGYRGRLAPSPTGLLHLGHASTFRIAYERARACPDGKLIFRNDDIDPQRAKPEFTKAAIEDLKRGGLDWDEGPDCGGPYGPYNQSERLEHYKDTWRELLSMGYLYPCEATRTDIRNAQTQNLPGAENNTEPIFPESLRRYPLRGPNIPTSLTEPGNQNWRFRVPDGTLTYFKDERLGPLTFVAGEDFGDFLVWRKEGVPTYELASLTDDLLMQITEVVRGADLLTSTARQQLLYDLLGWRSPKYYHAPLVCDEHGKRLAKHYDSLSMRAIMDAEGKDKVLPHFWKQ